MQACNYEVGFRGIGPAQVYADDAYEQSSTPNHAMWRCFHNSGDTKTGLLHTIGCPSHCVLIVPNRFAFVATRKMRPESFFGCT